MSTKPRSVADIKSKLLNPSLTSYYTVQIPIPAGWSARGNRNGDEYLAANGLAGFLNSDKQDKLNLLCCETTLPGSNIGTIDITGDYHGVTNRHASRRIYDDRIDMTFYVDIQNYIPIRYFETWMKYAVGESINEGPENSAGFRRPGALSSNYFYRMNYPDLYLAKTGLRVIKFEKNHNPRLEYEFINAFPISIASMPVSYETSSLLKCTVSFSYIRYILYPSTKEEEPIHSDSISSANQINDLSNPFSQANLNNLQFSTTPVPGSSQIGQNLTGIGALSTPNGISQSSANSSANTVSGFTVGAN